MAAALDIEGLYTTKKTSRSRSKNPNVVWYVASAGVLAVVFLSFRAGAKSGASSKRNPIKIVPITSEALTG